MYRELEYKKIASVSAIVLIFDLFINFRDPFGQALTDFIFDLIAINTFFFLFLWLKNVMLFIGFLLFLVAFNFGLVDSPLFGQDTGSDNLDFIAILLDLRLIAYITLMIGLFADRYIGAKLKLTLGSMLLITFAGTAVFQILIRIY
ncbi:hypothetical protein RT717_03755 [Imperialibacter roseus]|uniref:Uncharacterized protein n=1 Tax=Imperialibacter roseus TaxID=1324217 RepID=A0ABZ0IUA7_9BACT|nr:hypothetical protein [Imperialibacter roseus]WOK07724.1 hypothetical protein RT717_03685 [Imperialibacter roseus]WOK07738.1 hypothetical protein RT717_03755 [Imperialibacter roseus]